MYFALNGGVLRVNAPLSRMTSHTSQLFFIWMVGASVVLLGVAIQFLRNQIRPILRLAQAADAFGRGQPADDFKVSGATEVRRAAAAFVAMRERIARHVDQRTEMLAGVSHDLRTPITRLKLRLAMMPQDDDVAAVAEDVAEMEQMVEGFLAFARGAQAEAAEPVDLARLLDEVAGAARERGAEVDTLASGDLVVSVRRQALKRCLTNLVENARRHGTRLALSAVRQTRQVEISVDDNGPGIPEAEREAAFRPFVSLDAGRNLDQGGVGLGLALRATLCGCMAGKSRSATVTWADCGSASSCQPEAVAVWPPEGARRRMLSRNQALGASDFISSMLSVKRLLIRSIASVLARELISASSRALAMADSKLFLAISAWRWGMPSGDRLAIMSFMVVWNSAMLSRMISAWRRATAWKLSVVSLFTSLITSMLRLLTAISAPMSILGIFMSPIILVMSMLGILKSPIILAMSIVGILKSPIILAKSALRNGNSGFLSIAIELFPM